MATLGKSFVANYQNDIMTLMLILGKVFVREWAKYRFGVFEEHGYPGDKLYPMCYYNVFNQVVPNYCTNAPLNGYARYALKNSFM